MKSKLKMRSLLTAIIAMLVIMSGPVSAQAARGGQKGQQEHNKDGCSDSPKNELRGPFGNYHRIPGLTEEQKEEIKGMRITLIKEINSIDAEIKEKEARLNTLTRAEKPDSKAIDKQIEEISVLKSNKRKKIESTRQQIRVKLNEEQRLWFDQNSNTGKRVKSQDKAKG